ncbi:MAG: hypothetical protein HQM09_24875 [Candidatus Riflebacteria bacterium]|nr:hypothetical protein [Candidatus Riflebacteria bacterium]
MIIEEASIYLFYYMPLHRFSFCLLLLLSLFLLMPMCLLAGRTQAWPKAWSEIPASGTPFPFVVSSHEPHTITLLLDGLSEIETRLELIDQAKETICFETFIFMVDRAGRLILQALARKAREGVKVRLLIDKSPYFGGAIDFTRELRRAGVDVRLYNPRSGWLQPERAKWRDHRKYLSIDGKCAIVSGRNQGDDYFGLNPQFNFQDSGLFIKGPIIRDLDRVFTAFFEHPYARVVSASSSSDLKLAELFRPSREDTGFRLMIRNLSKQRQRALPSATVTNLMVASDQPGRGNSRRIVHDILWGRIAGVKSSMTLISPSFINLDRGARSVLHRLLNDYVSITVCTDRYPTARSSWVSRIIHGITNDQMKYWEKMGMKVLDFDRLSFDNESQAVLSKFLRRADPNTSDSNKRLDAIVSSLHSKTVVFDHQDFMLGSYNFDPQSRYYSSEMVLFVQDCPELASCLEKAIKPVGNSHNSTISRKVRTFWKPLLNWIGVSFLSIFF